MWWTGLKPSGKILNWRLPFQWIKADQASYLRTDLGELADTKDGLALINQQKHLIIINKLYKRTTPPGDVTETKLFIVPSAYQRRAIDGCHRDASHQGQNCTLSLAAERFWWPKYAF